MSGLSSHLDPTAPWDLVHSTVSVRNGLAESPFGDVATCCREACSALGIGLGRRGHPTKLLSVTFNGWYHVVLRAGSWILDPTAEQFGADGPLVFPLADLDRIDPPYDIAHLDPVNPPPMLHDEPPDLSDEITEAHLICALAQWKRDPVSLVDDQPGVDSAISGLLRGAGLQELEAAVEVAAGEDCAMPRPCFCGAESTGWWSYGDSVVFTCREHLPFSLEANPRAAAP